jgi:1-deoxy-D-xylulose-5-phosphate synthase
MLYTGFKHHGPAAVRYPRGKGPGVPVREEMEALPIGKGEIRLSGQGIAILAWGAMVTPALEVGEKLGATVANMRFVKPLDRELILKLAETHELVVTVEENALVGGAGSGVNQILNAHGSRVSVLNLGLPDRFLEHGSREELLAQAGLDSDGIFKAIERLHQGVASSQQRLPRAIARKKL